VTNAAGWNGSGGRVLFVPVSGARGMGEYARSLALAVAAARRWPALEIHFAVSRQASYSADTPFAKTLLPASPTFHTAEILELIRTFRPTLVVFDNAGRSAQIKAAAASGARVVYVSSRPKQRRKAFRFGWMRTLDEHWIAYPQFIAGALGAFERLKLRMLQRPEVRFLDAILPLADDSLATEMLAKFSLPRDGYVLVVPGGGSDHPGAENAPQIVAAAAAQLAAQGTPTIIVGVTAATPASVAVSASAPSAPAAHGATTALGSSPAHSARGAGPPPSAGALRTSPRIPMAQLAELIRGARVVVSNGGDTLLQAIASEKPCVAVPIAGDQPHRIARCEQAGLAVGVPLNADVIANTAQSLFTDDSRRNTLIANLKRAQVQNGLDVALRAIERLSAPRGRPPFGASHSQPPGD
jgi:ADP-heptose:LPS heptosyltransferase